MPVDRGNPEAASLDLRPGVFDRGPGRPSNGSAPAGARGAKPTHPGLTAPRSHGGEKGLARQRLPRNWAWIAPHWRRCTPAELTVLLCTRKLRRRVIMVTSPAIP